MRAEIIAIGDELTSGQRLDTNSQWLAERLLEIGVPVAFHTTVGDQLADNVLVFRQACERADIVVATGGLGPTADDLTRQALAKVAGVPLVQDDASLAHIKALFGRRKREMPPANVVQAQFPQGSRPIPNPNGTAPGIDIEIPRAVGKPARVFALPGVPAEMTEMWVATVQPAIRDWLGITKVIAHYRIKCFGVGESDLEAPSRSALPPKGKPPPPPARPWSRPSRRFGSALAISSSATKRTSCRTPSCGYCASGRRHWPLSNGAPAALYPIG
jgi:nicotinamide-nucleotide amidase